MSDDLDTDDLDELGPACVACGLRFGDGYLANPREPFLDGWLCQYCSCDLQKLGERCLVEQVKRSGHAMSKQGREEVKQYNVVLEVEFVISAASREKAEQRAEDVSDKIDIGPPPKHAKRWWPDELSKDSPHLVEME